MLKISNLSLGYKDMEPILSDANLRIASGVWLLEGCNGSGKSTFLNFLSSEPGSIKNKFEVNSEAQTEIPKRIMLLDNNTSIPNVFEKDLARFIFKQHIVK